MSTLKENIAAYEAMQDDLELDYFGKWVVFYDEQLVGIYDTSEDAAHEAITRFGRNPCLVKQVGKPPPRGFWHPTWGAASPESSRAKGFWHPTWGAIPYDADH